MIEVSQDGIKYSVRDKVSEVNFDLLLRFKFQNDLTLEVAEELLWVLSEMGYKAVVESDIDMSLKPLKDVYILKIIDTGE